MTSFVHQKVNAFGWVVHRKELAAGQTYRASLAEDLMPGDSENITLWSRGYLTGCRDDGYVPAPRRAGDFSLDRALMAKGTYTFTAVEPSEWWCINWRANRHWLPVVQPLRMVASEQLVLPQGTLLLVCAGVLESSAGDLSAGDTVKVASTSAAVRATPAGPVYGLVFASERT